MDVVEMADDDVGFGSDEVAVELTVEALPVIHDLDGHQRTVAHQVSVAHDKVRRWSGYAQTNEEPEPLPAHPVAVHHEA